MDWPEILSGDAQYHEADRWLSKVAVLGQILCIPQNVFHDRLGSVLMSVGRGCCTFLIILLYILVQILKYRKTSNISRTLVGNKIVDNSDVVGASPVGAAPTTSSFLTNTWLQWIEQRQLHDEIDDI